MTHTDFDLSHFKLDTLVDPDLVTQTLLTSIPVQKPSKQQFIRTHPDPEYSYDAAVITYEGETYLVAGHMLAALEGEYRPVRLLLSVARNSAMPFFWPLNLPRGDGRPNIWNDSAMLAAREAQSAWVRVMSDMVQGMYMTKKALGIEDDPQWPDVPMVELLGTAFEGKTITDMDHPVVRNLMGHA